MVNPETDPWLGPRHARPHDQPATTSSGTPLRAAGSLAPPAEARFGEVVAQVTGRAPVNVRGVTWRARLVLCPATLTGRGRPQAGTTHVPRVRHPRRLPGYRRFAQHATDAPSRTSARGAPALRRGVRCLSTGHGRGMVLHVSGASTPLVAARLPRLHPQRSGYRRQPTRPPFHF